MSLPAVSRLLNTSLPRVHRAARALGICIGGRGSTTRLDTSQIAELLGRLGYAPDVKGFSREDLWVLAALSRRPLGLRSVRAVARASGVSPSAATLCLSRLEERGLVEQVRRRIVAGGVVEATLWQLRWLSPQWALLREPVARVVLPQPPESERTRALPRRLWHLFWNADPTKLDVLRDADYLAARVVTSDDPDALAWMIENLPSSAIARAAQLRGLDERRREFAANMAAWSR